MLKVVCVEKIRDKHNHITHYRIRKEDGDAEIVATSEQLKDAMLKGNIIVHNLKLTQDNKLISCKYTAPKPEKPEDIQGFINKAKVLGFSNIREFPTYCRNKIYLMSKVDNHILYIPDNVKYRTMFSDSSDNCATELRKLSGTLKVIGGKGLKEANYLLACCCADIIDLTKFCPKHLISTERMFMKCRCKTIIFGNLDTSCVINMCSMFGDSKIEKLELNTLDTSRVIDMSYMFSNSKIEKLELSNVDTSRVTDMTEMFSNSEIPNIDLSNFNTSRVKIMSGMFHKSKSNLINISNFDTSKVKDMSIMFRACIAETIIIKKLSISNDTNTDNIFKYCNASDFYIENFKEIREILSESDFHFCSAKFKDKYYD